MMVVNGQHTDERLVIECEKKTFGAKSLIDSKSTGRKSKNTKSRANEPKKNQKRPRRSRVSSVVKNNVMKRVSPPNKKSFASYSEEREFGEKYNIEEEDKKKKGGKTHHKEHDNVCE